MATKEKDIRKYIHDIGAKVKMIAKEMVPSPPAMKYTESVSKRNAKMKKANEHGLPLPPVPGKQSVK